MNVQETPFGGVQASNDEKRVVSEKIKVALLALLLIGYFVQSFGPLRLYPDTIVLVGMAESAAQGTGLLYHGEPTVFPPVYPAILSIMLRLGITHAWILVSLNVAFLAFGLLGLKRLLHNTFDEKPSAAFGYCLLTLLSFLFIKYSAMTLTDVCFFSVLMWTLAIMNASRDPLGRKKLALIVALIALCISTRRVGVALIPALSWMIFIYPKTAFRFDAQSRAQKATWITGSAAIAAALSWTVYRTSSLRDYVFLPSNLWQSVSWIVSERMKELGEIAINFPFAALPHRFQVAIPWVGLVFSLVVLSDFISRRKALSATDIFIIGYFGILFVWTGANVRLWLPVQPLLLFYASRTIIRFSARVPLDLFIDGYPIVYAVLGIATLASSIGFIFQPAKLSEAIPEYRSTYCAAGYCNDPHNPETFDADGLRQLLTYR